MANFIDRWIDRMEGNVQAELSREESIERIAANLLASLDEKPGHVVLFAGTAQPDEIERVCEEVGELLREKAVTCIAAGNVLEDAKTISLAEDCDGVVLVEKQGKATYPVLEQEKVAFADLKKEILGFVLV